MTQNMTTASLRATDSHSVESPLCGTMTVDRTGQLWIGGCNTVELAKTYGTPLFVYDEAYLRERIRRFHKIFQNLRVEYEISYAAKAFCTMAMCQVAMQEGLSLDVVSGGELYTALKAGLPPASIHFHGNNKTPEELAFAVQRDVGIFVVDNFHELNLLNEIAKEHDKTVEILLRISPGVEAHTHDYIATGQQDSKFGFDLQSGQAQSAMAKVSEMPHVRCVGLHCHIGSQIFDPSGHIAAAKHMCDLYAEGRLRGLPLRILNLGGGFGIPYTHQDEPMPLEEHISRMVEAVREQCKLQQIPMPCLWVEPGRSIVGPAGTTLYTVGSQKVVDGVRNYVAVDGGMTDNPRLALYGAEYQSALANRMNETRNVPWTVAGKCCESGDIILRDVTLANPKSGDLLAVFATGAYNYSMASHYNRIPKPAVVFVKDGQAKVVVTRETWQDVARHDVPLADEP